MHISVAVGVQVEHFDQTKGNISTNINSLAIIIIMVAS